LCSPLPDDRGQDDPPVLAGDPAGVRDETTIEVAGSDERPKAIPVVGERRDGSTRDSRGLHAVPERSPNGQLVQEESLRGQFTNKRIDLGDGPLTPLQPQLAEDRDERDCGHDPAQGRPEPFRSRPDEHHPVGVDEPHVRISPPCCHDGRTIRSAGSAEKEPSGHARIGADRPGHRVTGA
jgi:hypothetical protein